MEPCSEYRVLTLFFDNEVYLTISRDRNANPEPWRASLSVTAESTQSVSTISQPYVYDNNFNQFYLWIAIFVQGFFDKE